MVSKDKCLNVIVFYDNSDEVKEYIKNIFSISKSQVDIALVVNKDTQNIALELVDELATTKNNNCVIFDYKENVGYLNALLKTIQKVDLSIYKYIILSNTDIKYKNKDFFDLLLKKEYDCDIGCIAPSVFAANSNSYSNPHYVDRISKAKMKTLLWIFKKPHFARLYNSLSVIKSSMVEGKEKPSRYVYSPHGCYMIFTATFLKDLVGVEYGVRLYGEESFIGEMLLFYEKKCYYDSDLKVIHEESTVTGKIQKKQIYTYMVESYSYLLERFYRV